MPLTTGTNIGHSDRNPYLTLSLSGKKAEEYLKMKQLINLQNLNPFINLPAAQSSYYITTVLTTCTFV